MAILKNTYLKIEILSQGAELKSIKDMDGVEYLLDDHQFWGYTSPHLFPSIGALRNQEFTYKGQTYSLKKHGFARNMDFSIVSEDDKQITYEIQSTDETLKIYPFPFTLQVQYLLDGKRITVKYTVKNKGEEKMVFSLGGHPAFLAPRSEDQNFIDYYLEFEEYEDLESIAINLDNGLLKRNTIPIGNNMKILNLDKRLFTIDTLLFKDLKSSFVSLKNRKDNKEVKLTISEFPFLGIWTTLGPSPFICIEPWIGHPDFEDEQGEFLEKEDSPHLGSYEEKSYSYHMDIL